MVKQSGNNDNDDDGRSKSDYFTDKKICVTKIVLGSDEKDRGERIIHSFVWKLLIHFPTV